MANETSFKALRKRFAKDYNLPINIFDEEIFNYYKELYDFFPTEEYNSLLKMIEDRFDGSVEKWLDYCAAVRDDCILKTMETPEYKIFNTEDSSKWDIPDSMPKIGEHSIYTEENDGKLFVSIDLKKANFQALKYAGVLKEKSYDEFVFNHGGDEYIAGSKYLRQVIFGKMNAGRTIKVEKYLMSKIYDLIHSVFEIQGFELYSMNSDELIFKDVSNSGWFNLRWYEAASDVQRLIKTMIGIDARVEYVYVNRYNIVNANGNKVDAYIRRNAYDDKRELKKASTTFFPQIYKLIHHMDIEEIDRKFFVDDQIATFDKPLRYENNSNK